MGELASRVGTVIPDQASALALSYQLNTQLPALLLSLSFYLVFFESR